MRVVFVSGKDNKTKDNNIREGVAKVGWGKGYGLLMVWPWPERKALVRACVMLWWTQHNKA
jgi:hypothetical protein